MQQTLYCWKQWVGVNHQVVASKDLESCKSAVRHVYVHVHSARSQQRRIKLLNVVGCENQDALITTTGP
jgi:hypothetical protein